MIGCLLIFVYPHEGPRDVIPVNHLGNAIANSMKASCPLFFKLWQENPHEKLQQT